MNMNEFTIQNDVHHILSATYFLSRGRPLRSTGNSKTDEPQECIIEEQPLSSRNLIHWCQNPSVLSRKRVTNTHFIVHALMATSLNDKSMTRKGYPWISQQAPPKAIDFFSLSSVFGFTNNSMM